jgi:hypothetical protein
LAGSRKSRAGLVGNGARNGRPGDGEAAARASGCSRRVQSRGAPPLAFSFSLSLSLSLTFSLLSICSPPREIREGKTPEKQNSGRGMRQALCESDLVELGILITLTVLTNLPDAGLGVGTDSHFVS